MQQLLKSGPAHTWSAPELAEWISNQQYVPRNLIAVVVRNVVQAGEQGEMFAKALRIVLELHPISIRGFWTGFCAEYSYTPSPTFRVAEKYGRPVDLTLMKWRADYDCYRNTLSAENWKPASERPDRPTREEATIDVMFFEVDPTHTVIVEAWLGMDMYPMEYEGLESKRDVGRRVPPWNFHGFRTRAPKPQICKFELGYDHFETGPDVRRQAQALLNAMELASANPYANPDWQPELTNDPALINPKSVQAR